VRIGSIYKWFEKGDLFSTGVKLPLIGRIPPELETVQVLSIVMLASFLVLLVATYVLQARGGGRAEAT
jgi:hypothetical protein